MEATLRKLGYLIVPVLAVVLLALVAGITDVQGAPTLTSDKLDYFSGDTAHISGGGYAPGEYALPVMRPNGSIVRGDGSFTPGWNIVTADAEGNLAYEYKLDGIAGVYEARVYPADWSGDWSQAWIASTTFTDSVPAGNLDQCANGGVGNPPVPCTGSAWQNGNLNQNQAHYFEGDSVPYRLRLTNLAPDGTVHTVTIQWDTLKSGKHAIDYLTTYNRTETTADPCSGVSGCSGTFTSADIPLDPMVTAGPDGVGGTPDDIVQEPGKFRLFGGTITAVSVYTTDLTKGDHPTSITISFTADVSNPVLAWGGHIATRKDWGADNSAVTIPGAPYHMRMTNVDGKGGNEDRSLSTEAVIFPASITIVKQATPEGLTSFPFTASPSPLANFSLVDDGTSANTNPFLNITNFTTYSITENKPAGWNLAGIACSVTSPNGGSQTVSLPGVSIVLKEGENVTCTFTNTIVPAPALSLVKAATPATYSAVGDVISYSYLVKNTGNVTLAGPVTVTDDKATVTCPAGGLAPGASMTCTASYTITQADLDGGSVKNTAQAHANGTDSNFDDETVTAVQSPALSLVKAATPATYSAVGAVISYSYLVKNTGNVTLAGPVTVTDDKATVTCPAGGLAPGATMTCTASYTITQADLDGGSVKNTAQAHANGTDSNFDDETVTAVQSPALSLVKAATPATYSAVGDVISYSYLVKNTGNVTLAGPVTVTDDKATVTCPAGGLAPGASMTCTASYTITQADLDGGSVKNTAQAHANGTDSNTDDETVTAIQSPALSLVKAATPATYSAVGAVISYSYLVKNTGNVTLAGPVTVTDDKATVTCPAGGLAPGATMTCTASYTITQADLDGGSVKNTAQAHANGTDSNFDDETVTAIQNPAIAIVKRTNGSDGLSILVGNQITWRYYVTNTGNVTLSKIAVSDDQGVSVSCPKTTLGVSESMTCTATGTAAAGQYNNIGTVNASDPQGDPATDNDPSSYFGANPQIAIDKVTNGADDLDIIAGTPITWTYTVTNVGNVTLSNIAVSDNQGVSVSCPKTTLAVGESMTCTATGVAVGGPHSNIGTASGSYTDDEAHSRTDTATDPSNYTGKTQVRVLKTVNNKPFSGPALTFELRQGAAPVTGQFGTVLETKEANVANNGQVTFDTLLLPGTYQLCEYVPEGYVPSYIWGTYGTDWFKPGYAPGQGGLDPNILVCVNFTVNVDGTINFQNGQQIVQPGDSIDIDNQVGQMPRTIGYWKNHASAKESNGGQGPVLDRMLYKATQAGQTITIGLLPLPGGSTPDNAGTSATYAVRLLNKSTINTNKKMASDPLFNLAAQLLGYRLNQPFGAWPNTVAATAADYAQQMLVQLNFNGTATHLKPSAKAVANLNYLAGILDAYNNDTLAIATLALPYPGVYK